MWMSDWPGPVVLDDETINSNNVSLKRFVDRERSAAANRMSHIFGLTGPTSTAETACSKPRMDSMSSPTAKKNMQKSTNLVFQSWHIVPPRKKNIFFLCPTNDHFWHLFCLVEAPRRWWRLASPRWPWGEGEGRSEKQSESNWHFFQVASLWQKMPIHHLFRSKLDDQMNPNIGTDLKHGLVVGGPDFVETLVMLWSCGLCY